MCSFATGTVKTAYHLRLSLTATNYSSLILEKVSHPDRGKVEDVLRVLSQNGWVQ
jgi:hypothetical protein